MQCTHVCTSNQSSAAVKFATAAHLTAGAYAFPIKARCATCIKEIWTYLQVMRYLCHLSVRAQTFDQALRPFLPYSCIFQALAAPKFGVTPEMKCTHSNGRMDHGVMVLRSLLVDAYMDFKRTCV